MSRKTRFVILSQPRTGGTLAARLLDSHPEIRCHGEILNERYGYYPARALRLKRRFPDLYFALASARSEERVFGSKLMVYEVKDLPSFVSRLNRRRWRVVNVVRTDVLGSVFSDMIARRTDHWHRSLSDPTPNYVVRLDPSVVLRQLAKRDQWTRLENVTLRGIEHVRVEYEHDLARRSQWSTGLRPVLTALGLPAAELDTDLAPTDSRPVADVVENLDEIFDVITASEWSSVIERFEATAQE